MDVSPLLPDPSKLWLEQIVCAAQAIVLVVTTTHPSAACPRCHCSSARVHSRYRRTLADLPWRLWQISPPLGSQALKAYTSTSESEGEDELSTLRIGSDQGTRRADGLGVSPLSLLPL